MFLPFFHPITTVALLATLVLIFAFQASNITGTALAFMMSVIALSLPEAIILRRVLRPAPVGVFFGVVALGIVLVGFLFNWLV